MEYYKRRLRYMYPEHENIFNHDKLSFNIFSEDDSDSEAMFGKPCIFRMGIPNVLPDYFQSFPISTEEDKALFPYFDDETLLPTEYQTLYLKMYVIKSCNISIKGRMIMDYKNDTKTNTSLFGGMESFAYRYVSCLKKFEQIKMMANNHDICQYSLMHLIMTELNTDSYFDNRLVPKKFSIPLRKRRANENDLDRNDVNNENVDSNVENEYDISMMKTVLNNFLSTFINIYSSSFDGEDGYSDIYIFKLYSTSDNPMSIDESDDVDDSSLDEFCSDYNNVYYFMSFPFSSYMNCWTPLHYLGNSICKLFGASDNLFGSNILSHYISKYTLSTTVTNTIQSLNTQIIPNRSSKNSNQYNNNINNNIDVIFELFESSSNEPSESISQSYHNTDLTTTFDMSVRIIQDRYINNRSDFVKQSVKMTLNNQNRHLNEFTNQTLTISIVQTMQRMVLYKSILLENKILHLSSISKPIETMGQNLIKIIDMDFLYLLKKFYTLMTNNSNAFTEEKYDSHLVKSAIRTSISKNNNCITDYSSIIALLFTVSLLNKSHITFSNIDPHFLFIEASDITLAFNNHSSSFNANKIELDTNTFNVIHIGKCSFLYRCNIMIEDGPELLSTICKKIDTQFILDQRCIVMRQYNNMTMKSDMDSRSDVKEMNYIQFPKSTVSFLTCQMKNEIMAFQRLKRMEKNYHQMHNIVDFYGWSFDGVSLSLFMEPLKLSFSWVMAFFETVCVLSSIITDNIVTDKNVWDLLTSHIVIDSLISKLVKYNEKIDFRLHVDRDAYFKQSKRNIYFLINIIVFKYGKISDIMSLFLKLCHYILHLIKQVSEAVSYINRCGIVHRDIKSQNIMIDKNGNAKLIDFQLSSIINNFGEMIIVDGNQAHQPHEFSTANSSKYFNYCNGAIDSYAIICLLTKVTMLFIENSSHIRRTFFSKNEESLFFKSLERTMSEISSFTSMGKEYLSSRVLLSKNPLNHGDYHWLIKHCIPCPETIIHIYQILFEGKDANNDENSLKPQNDPSSFSNIETIETNKSPLDIKYSSSDTRDKLSSLIREYYEIENELYCDNVQNYDKRQIPFSEIEKMTAISQNIYLRLIRKGDFRMKRFYLSSETLKSMNETYSHSNYTVTCIIKNIQRWLIRIEMGK